MDRGPRDHFVGRHYQARHVTGPLSFLNPTKRYLHVSATPRRSGGAAPSPGGPSSEPSESAGSSLGKTRHGIYHVWRSRDNRKGRHCAVVSPASAEKAAEGNIPKATNTLAATWDGIVRMFKQFPIWDVSYDVATVFTLGSAIWVINAFFVWLPIAAPGTEFPNESTTGGGVTAMVGATVFELGSILLMLEAVNENRSDCFGWALEEAIESRGMLLHPKHDSCRHHHRERSSFLLSNHAQAEASSESIPEDEETGSESERDRPGDSRGSKSARVWSWWPTWYELSTHYIRDIGFLACSSQMFGATIFWISGFTGLPPILNSLSLAASNGIFWLPQVVGGTGFIVSSILFMVEVQEKWYLPAPKVLGWHIGFWNLVGALGFTICGALGFAVNQPGIQYASTLSTFVGSWAFLIGSIIQWYESLDKYPITVEDASCLKLSDEESQ